MELMDDLLYEGRILYADIITLIYRTTSIAKEFLQKKNIFMWDSSNKQIIFGSKSETLTK